MLIQTATVKYSVIHGISSRQTAQSKLTTHGRAASASPWLNDRYTTPALSSVFQRDQYIGKSILVINTI